MSLRRDIHNAFEVIAPPLGGMPERVVQTVLAEHKARDRQARLDFRLRVSLALVATVLLFAIGVALVMTSNLAGFVSPAGPTHTMLLQQIEQRPIRLTELAATAPCPNGPIDSSGHYGGGPFHGVPISIWKTSGWGTYWDLGALTDAGIGGLMLVRAIDMRTNRQFVFVGNYAAGAIVGEDVIDGAQVKQRAELVFDLDHKPRPLRSGQSYWVFKVGIPDGDSGCYGWQIDGVGFPTETFVFNLNA